MLRIQRGLSVALSTSVSFLFRSGKLASEPPGVVTYKRWTHLGGSAGEASPADTPRSAPLPSLRIISPDTWLLLQPFLAGKRVPLVISACINCITLLVGCLDPVGHSSRRQEHREYSCSMARDSCPLNVESFFLTDCPSPRTLRKVTCLCQNSH